MIRPRHLSQRNLLIVLVAVIVIVIAGLALLFDQATSNKSPNSQTPSITPGHISIEGTIACLPHKGDGPHTMECAFGLYAEDGYYYGLRGLDQSQLIDGQITVQTKVAVEGELSAPPENEKYEIAGYIDIS